jgi:hypothetical protein
VKTARAPPDARQRLYDDNKKQVNIVYLAHIAVVQAEADCLTGSRIQPLAFSSCPFGKPA